MPVCDKMPVLSLFVLFGSQIFTSPPLEIAKNQKFRLRHVKLPPIENRFRTGFGMQKSGYPNKTILTSLPKQRQFGKKLRAKKAISGCPPKLVSFAF